MTLLAWAGVVFVALSFIQVLASIHDRLKEIGEALRDLPSPKTKRKVRWVSYVKNVAYTCRIRWADGEETTALAYTQEQAERIAQRKRTGIRLRRISECVLTNPNPRSQKP